MQFRHKTMFMPIYYLAVSYGFYHFSRWSRLIAFMVALIAAAICASLLESGTAFGVILGAVLGYFGLRVYNLLKRIIQARTDAD
jgi:ABC-type dipeptide/oligopeptide/nickel transport system permease subunit